MSTAERNKFFGSIRQKRAGKTSVKEWPSILYAAISGVIVVVLGAILSKQEDPDIFMSVLIQIIQLIFTVSGTYFASKVAASKQMQELNQQRARLALRRVLTLVTGLNKTKEYVQRQREFLASNSSIDTGQADNTLESIHSFIDMSLGATDDMIMDWKEVIPDDITKLEDQALKQQRGDR